MSTIIKSKIQSKEWRLNHLYKIIDKDGKEVVFRFNDAQELLRDKLQEMKSKGVYKLIILKARQLGFSTYKLIEGLDRALFAPNQTCIITAHKMDKMYDLFKKVKYSYEKLPNKIKLENGQIRTKPKAIYDNTTEYQFDNGSRIKLAMDSRSLTPTFLHITELAFVREAGEMMKGTLPSLPEGANLTIETTANGFGNYFQELRNNNQTEGEFETLFIPRYTDKKYQSKEVGSGYNKEHIETANRLLEDGTITKEQRNRYTKKASELGRDVLQEYPSTNYEAFLTTGNPVFDLERIRKLKTLEYTTPRLKDLRIYKETKGLCFFGVDTALGNGGDYCAIVVRNRNLGLVATYQGYIEPDKLCDIIDWLWDKGYKGKIGIENNNTGIATIKEAGRRKRYMFLYRQKAVDTITQKEKMVYGWNTNSKTRPIMINDLEKEIRHERLQEIDEREKQEMFSFVYNEKFKPEAMIGSNDDLVIADAICLQMMK